jgi:hypothetical protein
MDVLHKTVNWIDHNRWYVLSSLLAVGLIFLGLGCEPHTASLTGPEEVTARRFQQEALTQEEALAERRIALEARIESFNEDVDALDRRLQHGWEDLRRQFELRQEAVALLGGSAVSALEGSFSPKAFVAPALGLLAAAFGVGKTLDNRRKDRVIQRLKLQAKQPDGQS